MKDLTTSDFILYEDGMIYNNDNLSNLINSYPKFSVDYTFRDFNIQVGATNASMYYHNHGDFLINDTTKLIKDWLESASFVKKDGYWKMNFLHSSVEKK